MAKIPSLKRFLQGWLNAQSPRRIIYKWSYPGKATVLMVCLLIAFITSYKLFAVPDLKPGDLALKDEIAPRNALVINSAELQQKRSDLIPLTSVQVIDIEETKRLQQSLKDKLIELAKVASSSESDRIGPVNLTPKERLWLSKQRNRDREQWEEKINLISERMLAQGLLKTLAYEQLQKAANMQLSTKDDQSKPEISLASKLIANTFHGNSNLRHDPAKSQQLLEKLITKQGIPKIEVNKGELITRKGEKINQKTYYILDHFGLIQRSPNLLEWLAKFSEALASCLVLIMVMRTEKPYLKSRSALLPLLLLLFTQASKDWFGAAISPLQVLVPASLLISQGIGTISALGWLAICSLLWPGPVSGIGEGRLIIAAITAAIAAVQGGRMRNRGQLLQIAVFLPFGALLGQWILLGSQIIPSNSAWSRLAPNSETLITEILVLAAMLMITILLIPILEPVFELLTKARLLELADQERPLLRRLSKEAPGTFEHTLMICGLAEEGGRSINANVDLIRTGALYHDIGKLHAPEWFIENQEDGINPHDELKNPYKSADILQAHVDEGLKLAKRFKLPSPIADFIPEHQGTLKMGYFLHEARKKDPSISEDRFRYKGPIPHSRETAILMLADGCEAALRSLDLDTNDREATLTVRKIVKSRQLDGQLKKSTLTNAEIEIVINAFINVWKRMCHRRIKYPIHSNKTSF